MSKIESLRHKFRNEEDFIIPAKPMIEREDGLENPEHSPLNPESEIEDINKRLAKPMKLTDMLDEY